MRKRIHNHHGYELMLFKGYWYRGVVNVQYVNRFFSYQKTNTPNMRTLFTMCLLILGFNLSFAQIQEVKGKLLNAPKNQKFSKHFKNYNVFDIPSTKLRSIVKEKGYEGVIKLNFGNLHQWEVFIYENDVRAENYTLTIQTEKGRELLEPGPIKSYKGIINNSRGEEVRLTIDDGFIYGFITQDDVKYFIEPASYFDASAKADHFVVYAETDVIPSENNKCAAFELHEHAHSHEESINSMSNGQEKLLACYELELGIASDYGMRLKYGGVNGVENHNIGVMNNVETNYDDEFNHQLKFKIVTQFISTCLTCDPWTNDPGAGALLGSFRAWGEGNGFGVPIDLGQIWTNRDFTGGTIGIAYLTGNGTPCTNLKYHAIQDFSSNASLIRVVASHEIGHNMAAGHDGGGGFIMSPFVNNTNVWSAGTTATISNTISGKINSGCFNLCPADPPPGGGDPTLPLEISVVSVSDETCKGYEDGAIQVLVTGGREDYLYFWNIAGNEDHQEDLKPGTYFCSVVDANNDIAITPPIEIRGSAENIEITVESITNADCQGGFTGAIDISVSGGEPGYIHFWSNRYDTEDQVDIPAGQYDVTVVDAFGCFHTSEQILVEAGDAPEVIINTPLVINCNDQVVELDASDSSSGNDFTYLWTTLDGNIISGANTLNPEVDLAGTYNLLITNTVDDCTNEMSISVDADLALPDAIIAEAASLDCQTTTLSLDGSASSQTGNFEYIWTTTNGIITSGADGLNPSISAAGMYTLTVTNLDNGCASSNSVTVMDISEEPQIQYEEPQLITCNNGTVILAVTTDVNNASYNWGTTNGNIEAGFNAASADVTLAGDYTITVTNLDNGCSNSVTISVEADTNAPTSNPGQTATLNCYNSSLNLNGSGSSTGNDFTYQWTTTDGNILNNDQTLNPEIDAAGTYTLAVTNTDNGCVETNSVQVFADFTSPDVSIASSGEITCQLSNVTLNVTDLNNNGDVFVWTTANGNIVSGQGTNTIIVNSVGDYVVEVTNSITGCSTTTDVSVVGNQNVPVANAGETQYLNCNTPIVTLQGTGSFAAIYTYSWSGPGIVSGGNSLNPEVNLAGTYTLIATDIGSGCSVESSVIVEADFNEPIADAGAEASLGCDQNTLNLNGTNSSIGPNFTYSWSTSNGSIVSGIDQVQVEVNAAGTYLLLVTDLSNGCTASSSVLVNQVDDLAATISQINNVSCFGGSEASAMVNVQNGTGPFTFLWSNGATTMTATNLSAGQYEVAISDANGCETNQTININQPSELNLTSNFYNESSFGGNNGGAEVMVFDGTPPYTYAWSNGITTAGNFNLAAGEYSVIITDANNCIVEQTFTIDAYQCNFQAELSESNILCNGGTDGFITAQLMGENGLPSFNWLDASGNVIGNAQTIENLGAGIYTLIVNNGDNCSYEISTTLTEPGALNIQLLDAQISGTGANDGSLTASVLGGTAPYTYLWSNGATSEEIVGLAAGIYTLEVTDANGCSMNIEGVIEDIDCTIQGSLSGVDISCAAGQNGSALLDITAGVEPFDILWSNGMTGAVIEGLAAGAYSVTVLDAQDCPLILNIQLEEPLALVLGLDSDDVNCFGESNGSIDVNIEGGIAPYEILWNNGMESTALQNLTAGQYTVEVTDANGCESEASIVVNEPMALSLEGLSSNVSVNGMANGSIVLMVGGGTSPYTYTWSNGSSDSDLIGLEPGSYDVEVTDANGCIITESFVITEPGALLAEATTIDVLCFEGNNGSASVAVSSGTAPYQYLWSTGSTNQTIEGLIAGTYTVQVTDATGLTIELDVNITQPEQILTFGISEGVTCFGDANGLASITVTGGVEPFEYLWDDGSTNQAVENLQVGIYQVSVTDANGCLAIHDVSVSGPEDFAHDFQLMDAGCFGGKTGSITVNSTGGNETYTYTWSNGEEGNTINGLGTGTYEFTLTDGSGCTDIQSVFIDQGAEIFLEVTETGDATTGLDDGFINVDVTGGAPPYTYLWSNGALTSNIENLPAGTYSLVVTDANGCEITSEIIQIEMMVSNSEILNTSVFNVYPNPTNELINVIVIQEINTSLEMVLRDIHGHQILKRITQKSTNIKETISLSNLPNGVYILSLRDGEKQMTKKVILSRIE